MLSGLLYPVPPIRGGGPQIILYNTCLHITDPRVDWFILSNWEPGLDRVDYDHKRIIAIKATWLDKLILKIVNLLPYRIKKSIFSEIGDQERLLLNIKILRKLMFKKTDIIVVHESYPMTYLVHLIFPHKKIISCMHNSKVHLDFDETMWNRLVRASTAGIVMASKSALDGVKKTFPHQPARTWVIYNGIDITKFNISQRTQFRKNARQSFVISEDEFVYIYCGRIAAVKNLENLIGSFLILAEKNYKVKLFLVGSAQKDDFGDVAYEKKLHAMVPSKIRPSVQFIGFYPQEQLPEIYSIADCAVLATTTMLETVTLFLLEALACGIPVVATDVGGIPEVIRNGQEGIIIRRDYSQTNLMAAMEQMVLHKDEWAGKSRDIEAYIQNNFSWKREAEEFTAVLNEI